VRHKTASLVREERKYAEANTNQEISLNGMRERQTFAGPAGRSTPVPCEQEEGADSTALQAGLLAQTESFNNLAIPIRVASIQVIQQTPALVDHHDQTPSRCVIFCVGPQVRGQVVDATAQQCNLHFRRSGVFWMQPELFDYFNSCLVQNIPPPLY
jgi:hypothetical protein